MPKEADPLENQLKQLGVSSERIEFVVGVISQAGRNKNVTAEELVELLDKKTEDAGTQDTALTVFRDVCVNNEILPKSYYKSPGDFVLAKSGGTTKDREGPGGRTKVLFMTIEPLKSEIKRWLYPEIIAWKQINHKNVLPFLGLLTTVDKNEFKIVLKLPPASYMDEFINRNDVSTMGRLKLLAEAASGLKHLHSQEVKCGVIYPGNITITEDNRPCIGDFGTSYAAFKSKAEVAAPFIDYIAPELNSRATGSDQPPTKEGDIYSFGKTIKTCLIPMSKPLPLAAGGDDIMTIIKKSYRKDQKKRKEITYIAERLWDIRLQNE